MRTSRCGGGGVTALRAMLAAAVVAVVVGASAHPALSASAEELDREAGAALEQLYRQEPSSRILGRSAKGILVFPSMVKAGFLFGGQIGEGVLYKGRRVAGFYNSVAASYGLQAGVQTFSYALFFMSDAALEQLDATYGFELGVGPSVVLVDHGIAKSITTNTLTSDVYAYVFGQRGLMAGIGIQGSKITRIDK
jgi:lipid-binding SYLF domain-containing protein